MRMTLWLTFSLVVWIVLWALAVKPMDAIILALLILTVGATIEILQRYLPNRGT